MAIVDVTRLKDLRHKLVAYDWQLSKALEVIQFSVNSGNCKSYKTLEVEEIKLLAAVMRPLDHSDFRYNFSEVAGCALKEIVLQRLNKAIKLAAREARDEAQSVLDALEEV